MRHTVVLISLVAAVVAEAPYHLPRPAPQAPVFGYAPPAHHPPPPHHHSHHSSNGYNYQRPSVPQPPQSNYRPQPVPQPLPVYQPQPQPSPSYGPPQPIRPLPIAVPQPQPVYQPQPIPQPQPVYQPQPIPQPQPIYQPQPQPQPSPSYGVPQPIRPLPAIIAPQPEPQPQPQPAPIQYYQQQETQGYSYQQSAPSQSLSSGQQNGNSGQSSYQADFAQYNSPQQQQTHSEALDETVVSRVQNIIKDAEHTSARDAGYLSLVSGVSLENAKPSIEVLSFVHNSPLSTGSSQSYSSQVQFGGASESESIGFLPQSKPSSSYGVPH
nr:pollen-specific leucine-rich repeat extensin-like protein 2 [Vanessa tameamea]